MNKDQIKGRIRKVKGKATAIAGKLLHKPGLSARGRAQQVVGTVQAAFGDLKSAAVKRTATTRRAAKKKGRAFSKAVTKTARKDARAVQRTASKQATTVRKKVKTAKKKAAGARRAVGKQLTAARKSR